MSCSSGTDLIQSEFDKAFGLPCPELNDGLFYNDVVSTSDSELTLIEFYSTKHKNSTPLQGGWLQRIQNGQIMVDGKIIKDPSIILSAGSELVYHRLPWKEPDALYLLEVLYEDNDLIALNKPSGPHVLPGGLFQQRTVLKQLQWWARILLCAKTKLAKTHLAAYFADKTSVIEAERLAGKTDFSWHPLSVFLQWLCETKITKRYRALVNGIVDEDKVTIKHPIGIMRYPGVFKGLFVASRSGKLSLSKVDDLERDIQRNHTLVHVPLFLHYVVSSIIMLPNVVQAAKNFLVKDKYVCNIFAYYYSGTKEGDPLYVVGGQPKSFHSDFAEKTFAQDGVRQEINPVPGDSGYYLHAHQLDLSHAITNEATKVTAPLPSILKTQEETRETAIYQ